MQVHVVYQVHGPEGRYRLKDYEAKFSFCCPLMRWAWDRQLIALQHTGDHAPALGHLRVVGGVAHRNPGGELVGEIVPVDKCPWCLATVEIVDGGSVQSLPALAEARS